MARRITWLNMLRYGLPALLVVVGFVILAVAPDSTRWDGWSMFCGAGLAVLLLNQLYRIGATGDEDRVAEDAAREYLGMHGHWPDEAPPPPASPPPETPVRRVPDPRPPGHDGAPARPRGDARSGEPRPPARPRSPHARPRRRP